jgi:hypothetical protein
MRNNQGIPGDDQPVPGFERQIWKRIPALLLGGTLGPLLAALLWRWNAPETLDRDQQNALLLMDYTMAGVVVLYWTLVLTLALACRIVMIMKGPARWADSYPLHDSDRPAPRAPDDPDATAGRQAGAR